MATRQEQNAAYAKAAYGDNAEAAPVAEEAPEPPKPKRKTATKKKD